MSHRSVVHDSFTIEREFAASPARVFAAFATIEGKSAWFEGADKWKQLERSFDFRIGGQERLRGEWKNGMITEFSAVYQDIVPNARIVYSYAMRVNEQRISVSLATIELQPAGSGTRLVLTEQGAYLDGYEDKGSRERGTRELLGKLEASLTR